MRNNRGALTLDFIFALVFVTGLSGILFALSLTFVMVEVSQYIAFSTSRMYFGAHESEQKQIELSKFKFDQFKKQKPFKTLFSQAGWFDLVDNGQRDFTKEYFPSDQEIERSTFFGVRLQFVARMLEINVPFFGSTSEDGKGFKAFVTSFLGREPSFDECMTFQAQRFQEIQKRQKEWTNVGRDYIPKTDNGC